MTNAVAALMNLRRPRLLIRAARHGVTEYDRNTRLPRLIDPGPGSAPETILQALLTAEAEAETHRKQGDATYSVHRHIELLVALMGEARHLTRRKAVI